MTTRPTPPTTYRQKLDRLKSLAQYVKDNRLDFMQWARYEKQQEARLKMLSRIHTKIGPNIFVIFGSNRSGKTEVGAGVVAQVFKEKQDFRVWCATWADLTVKVQQRKLHSLIRKQDILYGNYNDTRGWTRKTIVSKQRTMIGFKTYEQGGAAFQGDDIDLLWLDEEPPYDVYSEGLIRLIDRLGSLVVTFTSLMGFTRVVKALYKQNTAAIFETTLTARENPFLSQEAKDQLFASIDKDEMESRWEGRPHLKQGLVYKEYNASVHLTQIDSNALYRKAKEQTYPYIIIEAIDPHTRTPHRWVRCYYDTIRDTLYFTDALTAPKESMLVSDFAKLILQKRGSLHPDMCLIDTSGETPDVIVKSPYEYQNKSITINSEFKRAGIDTTLVPKDNNVGINEVKKRLKYLIGSDGKTLISPPKIYFCATECKEIDREFMMYSWDSYLSSQAGERKEMVNKVLKKDDHYMDLIKYICLKLFLGNPENKRKEYYQPTVELIKGTGYTGPYG